MLRSRCTFVNFGAGTSSGEADWREQIDWDRDWILKEVQGECKEQHDKVPREREFFIDNLLARIHVIIEMILVDWPCAMGVSIPNFR